MYAIPDIQTFRYLKPAANGQLYIGLAGTNPLTQSTTAYWDYEKTKPATSPIRLDDNGLPYDVATGTRYPTVFVDFDYSIQIVDADNVEIFTPFISSEIPNTGAGSGDVISSAENTFTNTNTFEQAVSFEGDNSHTGSERFSNTAANLVSNNFGDIDISESAIKVMRGNGTNESAARLFTIGDNLFAIATGDVGDPSAATSWNHSSISGYSYIDHTANFEKIGGYEQRRTEFANLAAITLELSAASVVANYGDRCYVTNQGWATYEPPAVTGLGTDAWVLLSDPTTAIT